MNTENNLKIVIGADHAGVNYKNSILPWLHAQNYEVIDVGTNSLTSVDYPDYAHAAAEKILKNQADIGILLCGSANGVAITANKHAEIRAALCWQTDIAKLARQHNNANVICIPARFIALENAMDIIQIFLQTAFEGGRHALRVAKIKCI